MSLLDQVTEQLAHIELRDDDISEYITGIVQDESIDDDEKREVITEFLAEATDKSTENLIDTLLSEWKKLQEKQEKEGEEKRTKLLEEARVREEERRLKAEQEKQEEEAKRTSQKQLSKEEKEAREKLMREYAYISEGEDDNEKKKEESEAAPKDRRKGKGHQNSNAGNYS
ncbi:hypothetical protein RO3G_03135 [Rhizopus delemar RA 99-880]|uniref:CCDC43 PWI-like domain-containing protein n=1 Tax=Rhizopus delemar (strain RA 99-880 / ATCC MYA-4621 / FGSC 9543 / NRRL 43880) TaxID=246409 RepID=I1BQF1_RHIO9|nr:hypothetical protein RO3G_03135 [Rhizopus delemar RA 99-880]|eukprot:EIE78431.1 hypothetical protein RO3G_03135 [Rhizopus delemar RA 99-880]